MSGFDTESCRRKQERYQLSQTSYYRLGRTYFLSPQIANPQILGLFKQYIYKVSSPHIRKYIAINPKIKNSNFLMYANRLTVNPQIFIIAVGSWQHSKQKDNRSINNAVLQ